MTTNNVGKTTGFFKTPSGYELDLLQGFLERPADKLPSLKREPMQRLAKAWLQNFTLSCPCGQADCFEQEVTPSSIKSLSDFLDVTRKQKQIKRFQRELAAHGVSIPDNSEHAVDYIGTIKVYVAPNRLISQWQVEAIQFFKDSTEGN